MEPTNVRIQRVPEGRRGRITRTDGDTRGTSQHAVVAAPPRPVPVPGMRRKRRVAVALGGIEQFQEQPQAVRRRSKDGPNSVDAAEWIDPDDIRPNQRTGRMVRGHCSGCSLRRLQKVSREISDEHIYAAEYLRVRADVACLGFSAPPEGMPVNAMVYGPRLDFSNGAHARVRALDEFKRVWDTLRAQQQRMAAIILLENHSIPFWCDAERQRTGFKPNPQVELGKLVGMLDHLAKYLDADIDDAKQKGQMRI